MKLKRMWIACAESKDDAFDANRAAMGEYLLNHAYDVLELIEAAKVFVTLNNSRAHADRVLKALQPFEGGK